MAAVAAATLTMTGLTTVSAVAAPTPSARTSSPRSDVQEIPAKTRTAPLTATEKKQLDAVAKAPRSLRATSGTATPPVGTQRNYFVLDDYKGTYVVEPFTLRTVGQHVEVWVADDLSYPAGDCRNDGNVNVVTDAQTAALASEFDSNILPKESQYFSVAPDRDGSKAQAGAPGYFSGDGDKTLALISNVRDANFYAPDSPDGKTYIAGFFSSTFNETYDRNVMTIDSYDWAQRTGADPQAGTSCQGALAARPRMYEGTFAHEYQHLLEYYQDSDESTWLNEGLSDYAQTIVGYVDTSVPRTDPTADSHITCFEGWYGTATFPYCGAENSLTQWEDQGGPSVLSDYGAAYSFVTYLQNTFGTAAISYLHRAKANGLASVQDMLDDMAPGLTSMEVVHDWSAAMALDSWLDAGAKGIARPEKKRFTADQLDAGIDWAWPGSYDSPGAPPNGADYVLAKTSRPVGARTTDLLEFAGSKSYPATPLEWTVDGSAHDSGPALYSGEGNDLDRSMVVEATVPTDSPTLSFSTKYDIEQGWDFGVVQVSTDGGKTYSTLSNLDTTAGHDPAADGRIVPLLPGFSGVQSDWKAESFDLSAYAGKKVLVSFRYLTDPASNGNGVLDRPGWWVDDVAIGSTTISDGSTLSGARSATQVVPVPVAGWNVQIVGWTLNGTKVYHDELTLNRSFRGSMLSSQIRKAFHKSDRIGVIVSLEDPAEAAPGYATYTLKVNGVRQDGGR